MGSAETALSGYGPQAVYVYVGFVSYDQGGNYSTWYWELLYRNYGGTQWASDAIHYWELGGFAVTARNWFGIPSSWAGSGDHVMGSGYFTKGHDANGYLAHAYLAGSIGSGESSIGSGTAYADPSPIPRIPKGPPAPSIAGYGWDQITASSARFRFMSTGDGGSTVDQWQFQVATDAAFTNVVQTIVSSGTSIVNDLTPATDYHARARGHNAAGWGAWSATASMTTLSGIYVSDGAAWVPQPVRVSDGAAWQNSLLTISDGDSWEAPVNV